MTPVQRAADAAAAGSVTLWGFTSVAHVNEIVQLIAGVVAIVAGGFAIAVHWKRLRSKRQ